MYVTDLFTKFKKQYLDCNKKDYNLIQQVLSETQLFDLTYYDKLINNIETQDNNINLCEKHFYLPFKYCFVNTLSNKENNVLLKRCDTFNIQTFMFLQEEAPNYISGIASCIFYFNNTETQLDTKFNIYIKEDSSYLLLNEEDLKTNLNKIANIFIYYKKCLQNTNVKIQNLSIKCPQKTDELLTNLQIHNKTVTEEYDKICELLFKYTKSSIIVAIFKIQKIFNKLSVCDVLTDKFPKPEYYKRKQAPTIKINNRPIYYVMQKGTSNNTKSKIQSFCKLEYTHAFRVRGHWRRVPNNGIGKDRDGNYHIQGYTWVIDYIKGQGELVDKVRIVK